MIEKAPLLVFSAFLLVLAPRLIMIASVEPVLSGDSIVYRVVADNILQNLCVSLSSPDSGACVPHWGGNQLPGYPVFIAIARFLGNNSNYAPLVGQAIIFAAATGYFCYALIRNGVRTSSVWFVAVVIALSPSLVAWPRMMMTETLAVAISFWVLAEIINSIGSGSLRSVRLGLALAVGIFVRYDLALLALPVAITGFALHGWLAPLRQGLIVALVVCIPIGGWTMRSVSEGLSPIPPYGMKPDGTSLPKGMLTWIATWLDGQYELRTSAWALAHWDYVSFQPPDDAYTNAEERRRLEALIEELRETKQGRPVPALIDQEFAAVADLRQRTQPVNQYLLLPLRRSVALWFNPFASMGWPTEISDPERPINPNIMGNQLPEILALAIENPIEAFSKALVTFERVGILILALVLIVFWNSVLTRMVGIILLAAVAYSAVRTVAFSYSHLIEVRYMITSIAWLNVAVALAVMELFCNKFRKRA